MNNNNDNEQRIRGINKTPKQQPTLNTNNKIQNKERNTHNKIARTFATHKNKEQEQRTQEHRTKNKNKHNEQYQDYEQLQIQETENKKHRTTTTMIKHKKTKPKHNIINKEQEQ
jgi:hypothetical protein